MGPLLSFFLSRELRKKTKETAPFSTQSYRKEPPETVLLVESPYIPKMLCLAGYPALGDERFGNVISIATIFPLNKEFHGIYTDISTEIVDIFLDVAQVRNHNDSAKTRPIEIKFF